MCQVLQTHRFDKTKHSSHFPEIYGIMKQTYIKQVKQYRIANHNDFVKKREWCKMRENNLDSTLGYMVKKEVTNEKLFNINSTI